eukprot:4291107-Pleurochrysis_carterae.AAC.1
MPDGSMIARRLPQSSMVQVPNKNMHTSTKPKQFARAARSELLVLTITAGGGTNYIGLLGNCILCKQRTVPR